MIIQLDDYFIRVLQKSGYELDYNKLVKINEKAMSERKKSLNEYNELVLKKITSKQKNQNRQ
ncbi:hypothetical protein PNU17_11225 [Turicibacter sanguinis]|jgi:hypothetical protein|uniref:Uncharacterized protein n=1 Tax=Turicibacter sanguinis TaxID=154288 RepID=A0A9X5ANH0_9FIRM|nr:MULTISPECIES: hypothetical protein [Turicibacter]MBP3903161.1 hypothetical protein [Turicibacter sp.]MCU7191031.1 hypothetical protein [Turicibacter sanguinis]MCU7211824.1 hypothetical protein [Turicibacter sanguinis]MDB8437106.1 hypothetical protein [Turicibacter sanguinis]MDB8459452.1 hypothetical protein [Turicibacter sanguinis]